MIDDIKSAVGIGLDWFSPIGPMNFTLSQHLSKAFNYGLLHVLRGKVFWAIFVGKP